MQGRGRENSLDLLRILATMSVVALHVNFQFFKEDMGQPDIQIVYIAESLINIITRFSVPCFVMISGSFLLDLSNDDNDNRAEFYKKTSYKIFLPAFFIIIALLILSECQEAINDHMYFEPFKNVLTGNFYNMWYLYMLAGLYLVTPLIRIIKANVSKRYFERLSLITLLGGGISQSFSTFKLAYCFGIVVAFMGYYTIGSVIKESVVKLTNIQRTILLIVSGLTWIVSFGFRYNGFSYYEYSAYSTFFSPMTMIYSCCMFTLFCSMKLNMTFEKVSRNTYFVYLFHTLVFNVLLRSPIRRINSTLFQNIIIWLTTCSISYILAVGYGKAISVFEKKFDIKNRFYNMPIWKHFE